MKRTITGASIVAAGVLLFLANIDAFGAAGLLADWWPVFIIGAGVLMFFNSSGDYVWPSLVVGTGTVLLFNELGITDIDVGDFILPGLIVGIGVSVLLNTSARRRMSDKQSESLIAFMSGISQKNTAADFKGVKATAIMGGIELDLSKANIQDQASLDVFVLMGGLDVRVPEHVVVRSRAAVLLGGIEDKTTPLPQKNAPVLFVDGTVALGAVEIKR